MKLPISGGCLCGAIRYEISQQPKQATVCYCRTCQLRSGSDNMPLLVIAVEAITTTGAIKWYQGVGDSGKAKYNGFCAECGSTLFGKLDLWPHIWVVCAGTLDSPEAYHPEVNLWLEDAQPWTCINEDLPGFAKNPMPATETVKEH